MQSDRAWRLRIGNSEYPTGAESLRKCLSSDSAMQVLLIHEEAVTRAGLRLLMESWPGFQVTAEFARVTDAIAELPNIRPNIIVSSYHDRSGIHKLLKSAGQVPVIVLRSSREWPRPLAAQLPAEWVIPTTCTAPEFREALEKAHSRGEWTVNSSHVSHSAQTGLRTNESGPISGEALTERERDVALKVSQGRTNKQTAIELGMSEITVRHHLASIFKKLKITSRFELIVHVKAGHFLWSV